MIGSSEWMVFSGKKVYPPFLRHLFLTDAFNSELMQTVSGVGGSLLRARPSHVGEIVIPLPPLAEQKRLAAILDHADGIRRKRQQALRLTDEFLRSVFLDMFGDPVANPKGWPSMSLEEIVEGTFRNGLSPSNSGDVAGKVLTLTAITAGTFDARFLKPCHFDRPPSLNQTLQKGTFLICRGNGNRRLVGTGLYSRISDISIAFPDTMIGCNPAASRVTPEYLEAIWSSALVRRQIEEGARTTNGTFKVNQQVLGMVRFPLPAIDVQRRYAEIASSAFQFKVRLATQVTEADELFQSLQHRAFSGNL